MNDFEQAANSLDAAQRNPGDHSIPEFQLIRSAWRGVLLNDAELHIIWAAYF